MQTRSFGAKIRCQHFSTLRLTPSLVSTSACQLVVFAYSRPRPSPSCRTRRPSKLVSGGVEYAPVRIVFFVHRRDGRDPIGERHDRFRTEKIWQKIEAPSLGRTRTGRSENSGTSTTLGSTGSRPARPSSTWTYAPRPPTTLSRRTWQQDSAR